MFDISVIIPGIRPENWARIYEELDSTFIYYWPQVEAYAQSVSTAQPEKPVLGAAINWISHGKVMLIEFDK